MVSRMLALIGREVFILVRGWNCKTADWLLCALRWICFRLICVHFDRLVFVLMVFMAHFCEISTILWFVPLRSVRSQSLIEKPLCWPPPQSARVLWTGSFAVLCFQHAVVLTWFANVCRTPQVKQHLVVGKHCPELCWVLPCNCWNLCVDTTLRCNFWMSQMPRGH